MRRPSAATMAALLLLATGCSGAGTAGTAGIDGAGTEGAAVRTGTGAVSATTPRLLMSGPQEGYAVWPSGSAWVLLHTGTGWQQVSNATPPAVPTTGGLVLARTGSLLAVGVLPTELMTVSPFLVTADAGSHWSPGQLPAGLLSGRDSLAWSGARLTALVSGPSDTLVAGVPVPVGTPAGSPPPGWSTLVTAAALAPGHRLRLDAITWAGTLRGWLTGHGPAGTPVAFTTGDGGTSWNPLPQALIDGRGAGTGQALAPCAAGRAWLLPVVRRSGSADTVTVLRSVDGGASWATSTVQPAPHGQAVLGCTGSTAWLLVAGRGSTDRVLASADAGASWQPSSSSAPSGITGLSPVPGGGGYAAGGGSTAPMLWTVQGNGDSFVPVTLPQWVSGLAGGHHH